MYGTNDRDQPQRRHRAMYLAPAATQVHQARIFYGAYSSTTRSEDGDVGDRNGNDDSPPLSPLSIEEEPAYRLPIDVSFPPPPPIVYSGGGGGGHSNRSLVWMPPRHGRLQSRHAFPPQAQHQTTPGEYLQHHLNRFYFWTKKCSGLCMIIYSGFVDLLMLLAVCCMSCFFYDVEVKVVRTEDRDHPRGADWRTPLGKSRIILRTHHSEGREDDYHAWDTASDPLLSYHGPPSPPFELGSVGASPRRNNQEFRRDHLGGEDADNSPQQTQHSRALHR